MTQQDKINILKENRDSVISQIKWCFEYELKSGKKTLKDIMTSLVEYASTRDSYFENTKRMKTNLRSMVKHMAADIHVREREEINIMIYGKKNPSLAEMAARYEENNNI